MHIIDMRPLFILKIGGSVATHKDRPGLSVRTEVLKKAARAIFGAQEKKDFRLILIHGAGAAGHQLAKKYNLKEGTKNDAAKQHAAIDSRVANQKLNSAIFEIMTKEGLPITPVHTASVVIHKNKKIFKFDTSSVSESLRQDCIPLLYGEMVFDTILGMTVCSGDTLAAFLAQKFKAQKIFFASDINGIFDCDPYLHKNAKLIKNSTLKELKNISKISCSHNVDVTGGLEGKIKQIENVKSSTLKAIEFFNGLDAKNYSRAFSNEKFEHTVIKL